MSRCSGSGKGTATAYQSTGFDCVRRCDGSCCNSRTHRYVVSIFSFLIKIRVLGLVKDDVHSRDKGRSLTSGNRPRRLMCRNVDVIYYGLRLQDVKH